MQKNIKVNPTVQGNMHTPNHSRRDISIRQIGDVKKPLNVFLTPPFPLCLIIEDIGHQLEKVPRATSQISAISYFETF